LCVALGAFFVQKLYTNKTLQAYQKNLNILQKLVNQVGSTNYCKTTKLGYQTLCSAIILQDLQGITDATFKIIKSKT